MAAATALVISSAGPVWAQPIGRILGVVRDETSDAIRGAIVRAENGGATSSPMTLTAATDDRGRFSFIVTRQGTWQLTFEAPDLQRFPCLSLAYAALKKGGLAPCVMNAANEVAVQRFLHEEISFTEIPKLIEAALQRMSNIAQPTIDDIVAADQQARQQLTARH